MIFLWIYKFLTTLARFVFWGFLKIRCFRGKEDRARLAERMGNARLPRPKGRLVWFHGASVGEVMSVQPLIKAWKTHHPHWHVLLTSGTITSAEMVERRYGDSLIHQFIPLDQPQWVGRFLNHWQPDQAIWIESEIWPNLVALVRKRAIPMAMVNARLSPTSIKRWRWAKYGKISDAIFGSFDYIWVQDPKHVPHFIALGAKNCAYAGNLKAVCDPINFDPKMKSMLEKSLQGRPIWLAASTHEGEEARLIAVHQKLLEGIPNLLMILVPRHPERSQKIQAILEKSRLRFVARSLEKTPRASDQVYLVDNMGEMGLFYALSPIVFMAGSLLSAGGHNPVEPAQANCALLWGPDMKNTRILAETLEQAGCAWRCHNDNVLIENLNRLLHDQQQTAAMQKCARHWAKTQGDPTGDILHALAPLGSEAPRQTKTNRKNENSV